MALLFSAASAAAANLAAVGLDVEEAAGRRGYGRLLGWHRRHLDLAAHELTEGRDVIRQQLALPRGWPRAGGRAGETPPAKPGD